MSDVKLPAPFTVPAQTYCAVERHGCSGCAGNESAELCDALPDCKGIIWIKQEQPS